MLREDTSCILLLIRNLVYRLLFYVKYRMAGNIGGLNIWRFRLQTGKRNVGDGSQL